MEKSADFSNLPFHKKGRNGKLHLAAVAQLLGSIQKIQVAKRKGFLCYADLETLSVIASQCQLPREGELYKWVR